MEKEKVAKGGEQMFTMEVITKAPKEPLGWLEIKLPKIVMKRLQSYIETAKKNPVSHNAKLVGNISKSLELEDKNNWLFQNSLIPLIDKFTESYPSYMTSISILTEDAPFCLNTFWVNFQKENEFNPLHNHGGVFSFVIWVKIPTDWREQHALPFVTHSNRPQASDFEFHYTSMMGDMGKHTYCLDKESEGIMLFFPAKLLHTVYPFYICDKERVSISGNINFDISEYSMKQLRAMKRL